MSNLPPVPHRIPIMNQDFTLNQIWSDWFQKVYVRAGGTVAQTNDELYTITADRIPSDSISFDKMQEISTDRLIGRDTAATGNPEQISVNGGIEFSGSGSIQTSAFTGDVTKPAGSAVQTIANNAVSFIKLLSTDWTKSAASSGYQKLPSGIYIQWGATGSIATATTSSVSFPASFPTACLQVVVGAQGNSASSVLATGHYGSGNYSTTAFDLYNRTSISLTFNYIAVGY